MRWQDQAVILHKKNYSESDLLVYVLTLKHGHYKAIVKNGASPKKMHACQTGNIVNCTWHAKVETQLGQFFIEPIHTLSTYFSSEEEIYALNAIFSILRLVLPERVPQEKIYYTLLQFLNMLNRTNFIAQFSLLELCVLEQSGYGLDLSRCALGGEGALRFISPKTGKACSYDKGKKFQDKLFILPSVTLCENPQSVENVNIEDSLHLFSISTHFMYYHLFQKNGITPPYARNFLSQYVEENYRKENTAL